jgi:hypothetical protein
MAAQHGGPAELIVFYELTPSGSYVVKGLEILTDISEQVCEPATCNAGNFRGWNLCTKNLCTKNCAQKAFLAGVFGS